MAEEKEFPDIEQGNLLIQFRPETKEIGAVFNIAGGKAVLISKEVTVSLYKVTCWILNDNRIPVEEKFKFSTNKTLTAIGETRQSKYFKFLLKGFENSGIVPDYEGANIKVKTEKFALDLQMAHAAVLAVTNNPKWQRYGNEEKKVPKKTWAEVSGSIEEFDDDTKQKAFKLLSKGLIDKMLDVAELKVVNQRPKIGLTILISISSFMDTSIHNITTGPPGIGKSAVMDIVFDMFPKQHKESIGKTSTTASLLNMTKYKEGSKVLAKKLVRLGDLGNEEELKNAGPILGILREVMSDGFYDKNVTDVSNDTNMTQKLRLEGIGSVQLSTIEKNMEAQFSSRAVISSPDDNPEIAKAIKKFQSDDFQKMMFEIEYKKEKPVIACAIDIIAKEIETLGTHGKVKIINPYTTLMEEIFDIEKSKNVNRVRDQIFTLPKSVTLCNIKSREKFVNEDLNIVLMIMTPEDFIYALKIIGTPIKQMLTNISPQQQSFVRYIEEYHMYESDGSKFVFNTYSEFEGMDLKYDGDDDWLIEEAAEPCFTLKNIRTALNTGETTTREVLDELVNKKVIYKKLIRRRNVYFPTEEFKKYSPKLTEAIMSEAEFDELRKKAEELYKAEKNKVEKEGFKNRGEFFPYE